MRDVHATVYVDALARRAAAAVRTVRPDPDRALDQDCLKVVPTPGVMIQRLVFNQQR